MTSAVAPVHNGFAGLSGRLEQGDGRGAGEESCAVRAHRFEFFYSRFQISLHLTPPLSPVIALFKVRTLQESLPRNLIFASEAHMKSETISL
jgi:hypothetical protein